MKRTNINILVLAALTTCMLVVFAGYSDIAARSVDSDCINHGDVNLDGDITAADAQQAFYIVLGLYSPTYEEECAADCNGDDDVSAADAQAIFLVVLGLGDCVDPLVSPTAIPSDTPMPTETQTNTATAVPTNTPTNTPTVTPTHTLTPTSTETPTPLPSDTPTSTPPPPPDFAYIPPGTYTRGSPEDEPCRYADETQHQVTLTRGFHMMTTEVTRQMWADLKAVQPTLPDDPSSTTWSPTMNHPVQQNTWYEAVLFANLMSLRDGYTRCYYKDEAFTIPVDASNYASGSFYCNFNATGYRLPTEAEWEYACRAGTTGPFSTHEPDYSSGNCATCSPSPPLNVLDTIAWWCANSDTGSGRMAHPVGTKLPNPWGLYDMHGNVLEWCWDWYGSYPSGPVTDPSGSTTGLDRVERGGGWTGSAQFCRSAHRIYNIPDHRGKTRGFRLLRTTN